MISQDTVLKKIVQRLSDEFHPQKIFLFGSRADGRQRDDSDYDLFVIVKESDKRPIQRVQLAHRILWELHAPVDVFIYTEDEFNQYKDEFGSIANTVATEGVELPIG